MGAVQDRLVDLGTELSRRPEVVRRETSCSPVLRSLCRVVLSLIVDLQSGHAINWSIELWWRDAEWTIVGSQYWTAPFPYDGWSAAWETQRRARDVSGLLAAMEQVTGDLVARAGGTDLSAPETW